ncbi:MAG: PSD1 domain-containing protein [Planctomycetes bacterium]|nr:PSD1 domain-containing protein [Planctomycetota bacterium]
MLSGWTLIAAASVAGAPPSLPSLPAPVFERDVLPVLAQHCLKCHGLEAWKARLDLRTAALLFRGSEKGPVVVKGSAEQSLLYRKVAERSMPPGDGLKPSEAQVEVIRRWIDAGALAEAGDAAGAAPAAAEAPAVTDDDRAFWAFQRPSRPVPPALRDAARARTAADAFVIARLEEHGLALAPEADRRTLARRLSLDLTGLPPEPELVEEFLADGSPDAYERLADALLASPAFGERWGRIWLDACGYVDVSGGDNDAGTIKLAEGEWRYRDYVVRSFNEDLPLDRFLAEQIAGDELAGWRRGEVPSPEAREMLVATGFLRSAADDTDENELNTADIRHGVLARTVEVVTGSLLGLTIQCARCHDHKYDPIPQRDYYRLSAVFAPAFNPQSWLQPKDRALKDGADVLQAVYDVGPPHSTYVLRRGSHEAPGPEVAPGFLSVLCEPGETSEAAFAAFSALTALTARPAPAAGPTGAGAGAPAAAPAGATSGRRLAFARWLTAPGSRAAALVARVAVNRAWQRLFGRGLVETPENLGRSGARPTHPELLERVASELMEGGWRWKPLVRLLVTSSAYRQASARPEAVSAHPGAVSAEAIDPENKLLWRMRLRRLESEAVRDAILASSGALDRRLGGPPSPLEVRPDGRIVLKEKELPSPEARRRRSLYVLARRNYHLSFLAAFDQPVVATSCAARAASTVVSQALTLLNDAFVIEEAERFARRVAAETAETAKRGRAAEARIARAFEVALGRPPAETEVALCAEALARHAARYAEAGAAPAEASLRALAHVCQDLFNTSELLHAP